MQLKKILKIAVYTAIIPVSAYATETINASAPTIDLEHNQTCIPGKADTSNNYNATKWYRDSAEKNAQYNEIFTMGLDKVSAKVKNQQLKKNTWGIILDIDETVLDNSEYEKRTVLGCTTYSPKNNYAFMEEKISSATPGSHNLTCSIQKMGGRVVLVTNRDGKFDDKIQQSTLDNLKSADICFDNVVFANGPDDNNKTSRFKAVSADDYSKIIATNKLPKLNILAYFGDNIQDFPNIKQSEAIKESPNSNFYKKFGQEYFSLPNPTYGSWERNQFN